MFTSSDGCIMSAKKDTLVNMGGFLVLHHLDWAVQCRTVLIITEGYSSYGGLSGRDMEAITISFSHSMVHPGVSTVSICTLHGCADFSSEQSHRQAPTTGGHDGED